jgi:hypothetical protein
VRAVIRRFGMLPVFAVSFFAVGVAVGSTTARAMSHLHNPRACGKFSIPGERNIRITVVRGDASCSSARKVAIGFWSGKAGSMIPGTNEIRILGWTCSSGMAAGQCWKGRGSIGTSRQPANVVEISVPRD